MQFVRQCRQESVGFIVDVANTPAIRIANAIQQYVDRFTVDADGFSESTYSAIITYSSSPPQLVQSPETDRFTVEQANIPEKSSFSWKLRRLVNNEETDMDALNLSQALRMATKLSSSFRSYRKEIITFSSSEALPGLTCSAPIPLQGFTSLVQNAHQTVRLLECPGIGGSGNWHIKVSASSPQVR